MIRSLAASLLLLAATTVPGTAMGGANLEPSVKFCGNCGARG